jgi:hypothetical protein
MRPKTALPEMLLTEEALERSLVMVKEEDVVRVSQKS